MLAIDCICESIMDGGNDESVIVVVDSFVNEAVCYGKNLWVVKCTDLKGMMKYRALLNLKNAIPSVTLIVMGCWVPDWISDETRPSVVYAFGTEDYQPGLKVWKEFFADTCTFSQFCLTCSRAFWNTELVYRDMRENRMSIRSFSCGQDEEDSDREEPSGSDAEVKGESTRFTMKLSPIMNSPPNLKSDNGESCSDDDTDPSIWM
jgi:hypothetical protein